MINSGLKVWHYFEQGTGRPLVLLHGIGMSYIAWMPVVPYLTGSRRIIAFDTAGFGLTPALPAGTLPTVENLVDAMHASLLRIGIDLPVDIVGNSLGGCMALQAARIGIARTVVAISPSCLWKVHGPRHAKYVFQMMRFTTVRYPKLVKAAFRFKLLRELGLAVPLSVGSGHMPFSEVEQVIDDFRASKAFESTFWNTISPFTALDISVPVTVAFGNRDYILTKGSRLRSALPAHTNWIEKPHWGHVPMWIDPQGVAELILNGTK